MGMRAWHLFSALRGDAGRGVRVARVRRNSLALRALATICAMHRHATENAARNG
jgi:hypothetical protein